MRALLLLLLLLLLSSLGECQTLHIFHVNDIHAHYAPYLPRGTTCLPSEEGAGRCVGGVDRVIGLLRSMKESVMLQGQDSLFLHAGDEFQGTLFFTYYGPKLSTYILNAMEFDAFTFGNHEFDLGPAGVHTLLSQLNPNTTIVSSNVDFSRNPELSWVAQRVVPFKIVSAPSGARYGIVGVTTDRTPELSSPGPSISFKPMRESVQDAIDVLRTEHNVDKIIVLSHIGFTVDVSLAESLHGVDVIVGGHSHTDLSADAYPTMKHNADGTPVCIVQAWAWGHKLGHLEVSFDPTSGAVQSCTGTATLITPKTPSDPTIRDIVEEFRPAVTHLLTIPVAIVSQPLRADNCKEGECSLGNLITDAVLNKTKALIAFVNSGGIRSSIAAGNVSLGAVYEAFPFGNTVGSLDMDGTLLMKTFEYSCAHVGWPSFLQVSGIQVYCHGSEDGKVALRVKSPSTGQWVPVLPSSQYKVVTSNFLWNGGDGYSFLTDVRGQVFDHGSSLAEILVEYLQEAHVLSPPSSGRIFVQGSAPQDSTPSQSHISVPFVAVLAVLSCGTLALVVLGLIWLRKSSRVALQRAANSAAGFSRLEEENAV